MFGDEQFDASVLPAISLLTVKHVWLSRRSCGNGLREHCIWDVQFIPRAAGFVGSQWAAPGVCWPFMQRVTVNAFPEEACAFLCSSSFGLPKSLEELCRA